jgi:hypothetical protein
MSKKANTTPKIDPNLPSIAFSKGAGKSGGGRMSSDSIGEEKGKQRAVGARRNPNIGSVC